MRLLLDTHILIWAMGEPERLGSGLQAFLCDPHHTLCFSVASIWELVIKGAMGRKGFHVEPVLLRRALLDGHYEEVPITSSHVLAVSRLPPLHRDPFDRILLAQAEVEGMLLLTADTVVSRYPGPVRHYRGFEA